MKTNYGDKRDYRKIDILTYNTFNEKWVYVGTTTWSRTLKEAKEMHSKSTGTKLELIKTQYTNKKAT